MKNKKNETAKLETAKTAKTETAKTEKPIIKAETGKSETGFFRLEYRDGIRKEAKPQILRAFITNGIAIFSNGNFSQFGNGHAFTIMEEIKPFRLRVKKANIERHVSVHGAESLVLKKVLETGAELY